MRKNVLTTVIYVLAICGPERGLDWRGIAYAVVFTTREGEKGKSGYCR